MKDMFHEMTCSRFFPALRRCEWCHRPAVRGGELCEQDLTRFVEVCHGRLRVPVAFVSTPQGETT